jgi:hypothetical protein
MDKSSTSFPLISRQTGFEESDRSLFSKSSGGASRKKSLSVSGLRIAHWARRILSVTRILSKMGPPKLILVGWASWTPFASVTMWSETRQRHGSFERDSRHSIGHLHIVENVIHGRNHKGRRVQVEKLPYLVQVMLARGKVMPKMASMRGDFPALCAPTTAMVGMSRSG